MQDIIQALLDWRIILIALVLLIAFPVIFYLSSLDKTPVKVKRVKMKVRQRIKGDAKNKKKGNVRE